jgi:hypothetical protein
MSRRDVVAALGSAAVTWPLAVRAQRASKIPRIGQFSRSIRVLP